MSRLRAVKLPSPHRCELCHSCNNLQGVRQKKGATRDLATHEVKSPEELLNWNKRPKNREAIAPHVFANWILCTMAASLCETSHFLFLPFSSTWHFAPIWSEWVYLHLIWAFQVNYFLKTLTQSWKHIWIIVCWDCQRLSLLKTAKNNVFCISDLLKLKTSI